MDVEREGKKMQSTWTKGIQAAIRWQGGQHAIRQRQRQGAKEWVRKSLRRSTQPWLQPTASEKELFQKKEFVTDEKWEQKCLANLFEEDPDKKILNTWCDDFLMQNNASREELTKWLANKHVPWKRRRRLLQAITLSFPSSAWLHRIGATKSDKCAACRKVVSRQGGNEATVEKGTYGHIQSAACQATTESVTAAHNRCFNELIHAIVKHKKKKSSIVFVKEDKDVSFKTIWETSVLGQWCTAEQVEQAAKQSYQELERNQALDSDQEEMDIDKFWKQRPDRVAIDHKKSTIYIIEFKRTMDLRPSFKAKAEKRATRQHEWLERTLTNVGAGSGWKCENVTCCSGD